jgi:radical SAM protein with 4Fe4S-binding SPASM domain
MNKKGKDKYGLDRQYLKFLKAYTFCQEKVDYPFQWLMVEPTNHCNLQCVMCPQHGKLTRKKGYMKLSLFHKILDQAGSHLKSMQLFHSGEALLHPRIGDMIALAVSKNIYTLLNTNGTLLDERKARTLLDSGLHSISFSFDTFDKRTYESIRQGACFEKTLHRMERFLELKAGGNYRNTKAILEIVDMVDTRPHIAGFVRRANAMGFDQVRIWRFHNWADTDRVENEHSPFRNSRSGGYYPCEYPFFLMAVYWDGSVAPCCIDYNGDYTLGSIDEKSLEEIWNDAPARKLRASMRSRHTRKTGLCRNCSFLTLPKLNRTLVGRAFGAYSGMIGRLRK